MASLLFTNLSQAYSLNHQSLIFRFAVPRNDRRRLLHISRRKWQPGPSCAAESASCGGWDDLRLVEEPVHSGESAQLRRFLISAGLDDKRYVLVFVLGLVSALAITRVRISSVLIFPASVLVFAVGFSLGLVRSRLAGEVIGNKRRPKEDAIRFSSERLKALVEFFDGLEARVHRIKNGVQKAIDCNKVSLGDLQNYVQEIELISSSASKARDALGAPVGSPGSVLTENAKSSKKRKELGEFVLSFLGGLFGESMPGSNASKSKDTVKQEKVEDIVKDRGDGSFPSPAGEERFSNSSSQGNNENLNSDSYDFLSNGPTSNHDRGREGGFRTNLKEGSMGVDDREGFSYGDNQYQFVNNERAYMKASSSYETRTWRSQDNLLDFSDDVNVKKMETESSFVKEQWDKKSSGTYTSWNSRKRSYNEDRQSERRGRDAYCQEDFLPIDDNSEVEGGIGSSSSSRISGDVVFEGYLTEANNLLKRARDLVRMRSEEDHAQAILYKTAEILARAAAMKPMSLLAVGQLGNTYLLHGELKLRMSRDLRTLLSSNEPLSFERRGGGLSSLDYSTIRKDKIASALVGVCEECEELLVEAGRKYRVALSIDGNDVRALYNWGLALSFRAQLIADIGPDAAYDADKVFLAAIDKFNAMMSKGNVYAPDALFRWGVALQQRSRLRPTNSKEKVKLLEQARRLYEDALHMDSDNPRVREALSSCMSELRSRNSGIS